MKKHLMLLCIALMVAVLAVPGCGGSDTTTDTTAPAGGKTDLQDKAETAATVTIENFAFTPGTITVVRGGTVTWTNKDSALHTATDEEGDFDTGDIEQNKSVTLTFDESGTFKYICSYHPNMKGTIIVE